MHFADRELQSAIRDVLIRAAYGEPPSPPADLATRIHRQIDGLKTERNSLHDHCKTELGALLVHSTLIYLWAIRPDDVVLCIDHEAFGYPSEPETDPLDIFAAWVHAAETYPELADAIPQPPKGTEPCRACHARGYSEQGSEHCHSCSGMGWRLK